ncbi:hypothetical protein BRC86_02890 [Halobacteriales archaeon QS_3_64_16]|nr:MAG: hypothetical protein BRC86_02890 [Halobacteriales archaeon QS_3_64_16]
MSERATGETIGPDERAALESVLEEYPIRLATLFGSHADGTAGQESDVDVGIEFERAVARTRRVETVLRLVTDLMSVLDRDEIDVSLIGDFEPTVGRAALESTDVLVGSADRLRDQADEPSLRKRTDRVRARLRQ